MKKAFTVVELIVVIAVISILTAIIVPLIGVYGPPARLSGDSKIIAATFRKAQQFSLSTEKRYGVKFYKASQEYRIFIREFDEVEQGYAYTDIETQKLSTGINFDTIVINGVSESGDAEIYFDAFGSPKDGDGNHADIQVTIKTSKGSTSTVEVKKNTGYVKVN